MAVSYAAFDPAAYPQYFAMEADRIVYLRTAHGARAKSYVWNATEEKVRAWYYVVLVEDLKYPVERIDLEVEVFRRKPEDFADLVVYEDRRRTHASLLAELAHMRATRRRRRWTTRCSN